MFIYTGARISQDFFICKYQKPNSNRVKKKKRYLLAHLTNRGRVGFRYGHIERLKTMPQGTQVLATSQLCFISGIIS